MLGDFQCSKYLLNYSCLFVHVVLQSLPTYIVLVPFTFCDCLLVCTFFTIAQCAANQSNKTSMSCFLVQQEFFIILVVQEIQKPMPNSLFHKSAISFNHRQVIAICLSLMCASFHFGRLLNHEIGVECQNVYLLFCFLLNQKGQIAALIL